MDSLNIDDPFSKLRHLDHTVILTYFLNTDILTGCGGADFRKMFKTFIVTILHKSNFILFRDQCSYFIICVYYN